MISEIYAHEVCMRTKINEDVCSMKRLTLIALTAIGCGVGSVAFAAEDSDQKVALGSDEIKQLFPGNYKAEVAGYDMLITGSTNGNLRGRAFSRQDRGKWWVQEDTLCVA